MELNTRGRYAVMAMADLAKHGGGSAVALSAIAQRQKISLDYLEQLFLKLRRSGLVESQRGRYGGYKLSRPAAEIFVAEIMTAVDEGTRMTRCFGDDTGPCLGDTRCLTHDLWTALGAEIENFLARVSLRDVLEGIPSRQADGAVVNSAAPEPVIAALERATLERPGP